MNTVGKVSLSYHFARIIILKLICRSLQNIYIKTESGEGKHVAVLTVYTLHLLILQCVLSLWDLIVLLGHNTVKSTLWHKASSLTGSPATMWWWGGGNASYKLLSTGFQELISNMTSHLLEQILPQITI